MSPKRTSGAEMEGLPADGIPLRYAAATRQVAWVAAAVLALFLAALVALA